jgi:hypothetical protein
MTKTRSGKRKGVNLEFEFNFFGGLSIYPDETIFLTNYILN